MSYYEVKEIIRIQNGIHTMTVMNPCKIDKGLSCRFPISIFHQIHIYADHS